MSAKIKNEYGDYDADYDDNNSTAADCDDDNDGDERTSKRITTRSPSVSTKQEEPQFDFAQSLLPCDSLNLRTESGSKILKRRVIDFSSGEEDFIPSHQRLTDHGGYTHTKSSRLKISMANKGNIPWNKGKNRSSDAKAKISAGVRARNHAILLKKLEKLGLTEEEWYEYKKKIKVLRERVRKVRQLAMHEDKVRETKRLLRREEEEKEWALRRKLAKQEVSDDGIASSNDEATGFASDEELQNQTCRKERESPDETSMNESEYKFPNDRDDVLVHAQEAIGTHCSGMEGIKEVDVVDEHRPTPSIFVRDFIWTPHPLDSNDLSFKDLCPYSGPGGLICCETCTANYSKLLSKSYRDLEEQKLAKIGEEISELLQFTKEAKRNLSETICIVRTKPVPLHNSLYHEDVNN